MRFPAIQVFAAAAAILHCSVAGPLSSPAAAQCNAQRRIEIAKEAVYAIQKPTAAESTAAYEALAFSPDARIIINPNEIGDIPVSLERQTSIGFLAIIYQIVTDVHTDKYLNIDDTHSFFNVTGDLGLLHKIPVPAHVFFDVFLTYTLVPCALQVVHVYAQVPSDVLGVFVDIATGVSPTPRPPVLG
ncbi:hypothetical protein EJ05DRAFT_514372 [Pseudovirgaria hyperparasitica]|uniref:Uncharacterized protein n=1 Tax=Pseudovirgaria hyperparasitica TaxID=470096 RepID=A0A6A6VUP4_9PEZI|nr:uncharacterized protein EJ05DRAFT_514372 [Pseudovirgaria hyperparasitica]KAF2753875.1 hypothetical protein EJ05DRAFT_514372 [Pseudovirgaria hyperparasitica]